MAIALLFCLGVLHFAAHKAVLESGHRLLGDMDWYLGLLGGRISLLVEYVMLAGAMLMTDAGSVGWAWGYAAYSALSGLSAWLILTRRV
ncbi:hypothetical protein B2G71_13535 [Novosphingobium sp. PC22D]|uniref:hypothetical protein n=1 Tax=Novosphingobium sp. PC22D TaxID=1962403 RepID=UPI000BF04314|nr:hypothetical protein [Novosphingobium sp. PC22D]PEQ12157.1 hypothetical protein B2G71_13535 [Novosphingobium sp. PC22D]